MCLPYITEQQLAQLLHKVIILLIIKPADIATYLAREECHWDYLETMTNVAIDVADTMHPLPPHLLT